MGKTCHFSEKKYIFAIELRISKRFIDMKKEKNLESLSDDEILQGFKDAEHDGFENMRKRLKKVTH